MLETLLKELANLRRRLGLLQSMQWDTYEHSLHSVRVLCDEEGLTPEQKRVICACIYQESQFNNKAKGYNKDHTGHVVSTDWGIVQVNDYWNIGPGKYWKSVDEVLNNPEKAVRWMISCYKHGSLRLWASYSTGAYRKHLHLF